VHTILVPSPSYSTSNTHTEGNNVGRRRGAERQDLRALHDGLIYQVREHGVSNHHHIHTKSNTKSTSNYYRTRQFSTDYQANSPGTPTLQTQYGLRQLQARGAKLSSFLLQACGGLLPFESLCAQPSDDRAEAQRAPRSASCQ